MAIEEVINQKLVEALLRIHEVDVQGVPLYALLDLGFRGRIPDSNLVPCAALVRQAHRRHSGGQDLVDYGSEAQEVQIKIEVLLRHYGLTSVTPMSEFRIMRDAQGRVSATYGGHEVAGLGAAQLEIVVRELALALEPGSQVTFGGINVQTTREVSASPLKARLVDFGHYCKVASLDDPMLSLVSDRTLNWGGAIWPREIGLAADGECVASPLMEKLKFKSVSDDLAVWFGTRRPFVASEFSEFSLLLAKEFAEGNLSPVEFETRLNGYVEQIMSQLPHRALTLEDGPAMVRTARC